MNRAADGFHTLAMADMKPPKRGGGGFKTFAATLIVLLTILLLFGFLAARTEGFRSYLEGELQKRAGCAVRVGDTRVGWPYDLVLENVSLGRGGAGALTIQEARIGLWYDLTFRIAVRGASLTLAQTTDGVWEPKPAAPLGPLGTIEDVSEATADFTRRPRIEITDSTIEWADADGRIASAVKRFDLVMTPVRLPNRWLYHYRLTAREVLRPNGARMRDVEREWLCAEDRPYIEMGYKADWGMGPDAPDMWSRTPSRAGREPKHADSL